MRDRKRVSQVERCRLGGGDKPEKLAQHLADAVQQAFVAVNGAVTTGQAIQPEKLGRDNPIEAPLGPGVTQSPDELAQGVQTVARKTIAESKDTEEMNNLSIEKRQMIPTPVENTDFTLSGRFPRWKRCLDITCILLTMPIWLPLMILAMLAIKTVSKGPVFFRQRRVGLDGKEFMILKFRSMLVNAETRTHESYVQQLMRADCPMTKLDSSGDSRLIPGGRLLRATALDELPQIFNVLRGEMTLVGPRPCTPSEFEHYLPRHKKRCQFPPGLTGYWQVNGKNKMTFSEMIEMDLHYGERMSLWLDISIMAKTFPALIEQVLESQKRRRMERETIICEQVPAFETIREEIN